MAVPVLWSEVGREEGGRTRRTVSLWAVVQAGGDEGDGTAGAVAAVLVAVFQTARPHLHSAAGTNMRTSRRAVAWRQDGLVGSSRGDPLRMAQRQRLDCPVAPGRLRRDAWSWLLTVAPVEPVFLPREQGGAGLQGHDGGR